jgi:uncharacterized protein YggU (UPF0235/DUF167 family)
MAIQVQTPWPGTWRRGKGLGHGETMTDLSHLATPGSEISLRVTPRAGRNALEWRQGALRAYVTTVPEDGKANDAVRKLLAKALGIAPTRLVLLRGQTARDKVFMVAS